MLSSAAVLTDLRLDDDAAGGLCCPRGGLADADEISDDETSASAPASSRIWFSNTASDDTTGIAEHVRRSVRRTKAAIEEHEEAATDAAVAGRFMIYMCRICEILTKEV